MMTTRRVSQPILRLDVVHSNGERTADSRVFCRKQHRSVRVEGCCECVHCDAITSGAHPSVDCSVPQECLDAEADPTGEHTEIGALLRAGTMVIAQSATVGAAVRLMNSKDLRSVAIVDEHDVLVGVVRESGFLGRSRASESALQLAMSTPLAVHEQTPVRLALRMLAANHLREITVVAEDGTPIGVFRDVDGLHWIAVARGAIPEDGEEG